MNELEQREYNRCYYQAHKDEIKARIARNRASNPDADKRRVKARQAWVNSIKSAAGCSECGYNENPVALDFHHTDNTKEAQISRLHRREAILAEIEKCIVLCANCHRIHHHG